MRESEFVERPVEGLAWECPWCGALVKDRALHVDWHDVGPRR